MACCLAALPRHGGRARLPPMPKEDVRVSLWSCQLLSTRPGRRPRLPAMAAVRSAALGLLDRGCALRDTLSPHTLRHIRPSQRGFVETGSCQGPAKAAISTFSQVTPKK